MKLTDPQWRVLTFLAERTKWISLPEMAQVHGLKPGDSECVSPLIDLKLVEVASESGLRVRLTPAGQVVATDERQA
jgi:hypothetical protein